MEEAPQAQISTLILYNINNKEKGEKYATFIATHYLVFVFSLNCEIKIN